MVNPFDDAAAEIRAHEEQLIKDLDWKGLIDYCVVAGRRLSAMAKLHPDLERKCTRFRASILQDKSFAFGMLARHDDAAKAVRAAIRHLRKLDGDVLDMHFAQVQLCKVLRQAQDYEGARVAALRSMTCLLSKWQTEWVVQGLLEMSDIEALPSSRDAGEALSQLAAGLRHERQWASMPDQQAPKRRANLPS